MVDFVTGLSAASQALGIAKQLRDAGKTLSDAEFKLQIADLYEKLSDVKILLADAREEVRNKDEEIRRLKEIENSKPKIIRKDGYGFGVQDGSVNPAPFCPTCEQQNGKYLQMAIIHGDMLVCSVCKRVDQRVITPPRLPIE